MSDEEQIELTLNEASHVAVFKPALGLTKVFCERCLQIIPLRDHASACPGAPDAA